MRLSRGRFCAWRCCSFGHERGAFSGAVGRKTGRFEMAEGGSIFLDEIGELSPNLPAKLLRVLQEQSEAANRLQINRRLLYKKMEEYKISD